MHALIAVAVLVPVQSWCRLGSQSTSGRTRVSCFALACYLPELYHPEERFQVSDSAVAFGTRFEVKMFEGQIPVDTIRSHGIIAIAGGMALELRCWRQDQVCSSFGGRVFVDGTGFCGSVKFRDRIEKGSLHGSQQPFRLDYESPLLSLDTAPVSCV